MTFGVEREKFAGAQSITRRERDSTLALFSRRDVNRSGTEIRQRVIYLLKCARVALLASVLGLGE